jgi:PAS domain S-box-containing protein
MQDGEEALSLLAGRGLAGREFFEAAARALTLGLGCRWAGVGQLRDDGQGVQLLALWDGDKKVKPFAFDLAGTPCEKVFRPEAGQPHWFFSDRPGEAFPDALLVKKTGAACYRGEAFCDAAGAPLGHVFALGEKAEEDDPQTRAFLRVVSEDVGAEFTRWHAEETLRAREAALEKAQAMAKIGHWRWSIAGDRLLACSPEYRRIHGVDPAASRDYMSDMMENLVHPEDCDRVAEAFMKLEDEGLGYEIEYRIRHPEGETRHLLAVGEAVRDAAGRAVEHIGTVQDITARQASPGARAGAGTSVPEAPAAAHAKAKSSHDFRTPLNVIVGFSEIISGELFGPVGNEKYRKYASDIYDAGQRMLELISDDSDAAEAAPGGADARKEESKFPASYEPFKPL